MNSNFQSPLEAELDYNFHKIADTKLRHRNAWLNLIADHGPFLFMVTVQFQRSYPDGIAMSAINQFFYNMNRQIFRRKWFRKQLGFTGIVIAEQSKLRALTAGDLHFHCLLNPNDVIQSHDDEEVLVTNAQVSANKLKDSGNRFMCSLTGGVDIKPIENTANMLVYLTKEFHESVSETGDQIYFLDYEGLQDGCLDKWRKRSC